MDQILQSLITTLHSTANSSTTPEANRKLAREARLVVMDLLKLYKNPKTRPEADQILSNWCTRKEV